MSCDSLDCRSSTIQLALKGISCDMRCRDIHPLHQFLVYVRFIVPCINDDGSELVNGLQKCFIINDFATGGVDEHRTRTHFAEKVCRGHSPGGLIKRDMHCDYL